MAGCSSSSQVDTFDITPVKIFSKPGYLFRVNDFRKIDPNVIEGPGERRTIFRQPLSQYISEYFNKSIELIDSTVNKEISVHIDQLKIEKFGSLKYSFWFYIPVNKDTSEVFRIAGLYVEKDKIDNKGLLKLALSASLDSLFSNTRKGLLVRNNEDKEEEIPAAILQFEKNTTSIVTFSSDSVSKIPANRLRKKHSSIGFSYFKGDDVQSGFQIYYTSGSRRDEENFMFSYGISFLYYDIENSFFKGNLFSFGVPLVLHYYFPVMNDALFTSLMVRLTGGKEKAEYGFSDKESYYIGPVIEPSFGYQIRDIFSIDAGFFFLKLFGSKILPEDAGIRFNINLWF